MREVLSIANLKAQFQTAEGHVQAVNGVSLQLHQRQIFGLIGETGSGKSVLGLSVLGLLPRYAQISGEVMYGNRNLLTLSEQDMQHLRGRELAFVPQNPATSLNPVMKAGKQVQEAVRLHNKLSHQAARAKVLELFTDLQLPDPEKVYHAYPFQLSGGMKQRVLAAIGLAGNPKLLVADEPTKGLDAMLRTQVIELLQHMVQKSAAALLVITHDLQVAEALCDEIGVMYAGQIVEQGSSREIFENPQHPYTQGLIASHPAKGMKPLLGMSPSLVQLPSGCTFHPRCSSCSALCKMSAPERFTAANGSKVRCHLVDQNREPEQDIPQRIFQEASFHSG